MSYVFLVQYSDSCLRELHRTKNNNHGTSEKHFQITDLCQLCLIFYCELGVLKTFRGIHNEPEYRSVNVIFNDANTRVLFAAKHGLGLVYTVNFVCLGKIIPGTI